MSPGGKSDDFRNEFVESKVAINGNENKNQTKELQQESISEAGQGSGHGSAEAMYILVQ